MRIIRAFAFLITSILIQYSSAMEINYSSVNPFSGSVANNEGVLLKGEIVPGDYEYLLNFINGDQNRFMRSSGVILASNGGDIQEALRIARFIKSTYMPVFVGSHTGPCVSACFFIYASAARRDTAGNKSLGVHRPYIHPRRLVAMPARDSEILQQKAMKQARAYLEEFHVPSSIIDKMFQHASTEVYWLSSNEIDEQLGRRPPWYEQFLIARCGLDKSIESKYFKTNDVALREKLWAIDDCGSSLTQNEAKEFIKKELALNIKKR